ncbi:hypothetical protein ACIBF7_33525 [Nonomuraea sp. NPDC050478]
MTAARGFPAFPRQRAGARFATTWWGQAWLKALADTSLDQGLLQRGRAYAKTGQLGPITVSPGRLAAVAEHEHDTVVRVEQLSDAAWDRFLDQVAAKAGHIAALLDRDMPHDLVRAAEAAGVPLLPAVGDLEPECSCPDWACRHAAALCYQASWLLDADPFVLLLLRGRGEQELIEALHQRDIPGTTGARSESAEGTEGAAGTGGAAGARAGTLPGTPAREAFARGVPPLPEPPPLDAPHAPLGLEPAPGVDVAALEVLAASAASRARDLLVSGRLPALTEHQDRVRMSAAFGLDLGLDAQVAAWRHGGAAGLEALETAWTPARQDLARAQAMLDAAWEGEPPAGVESARNRWTIGDRQLRYGRDGRWYPFERRGDTWWPAGPPARDPAALLG